MLHWGFTPERTKINHMRKKHPNWGKKEEKREHPGGRGKKG